MITVHKGFICSILEGDKTLEIRTRIPHSLNIGDVLLICQSGNGNNVSIRAYVGGIIKTTPGIMFGNFFKQIQLNCLAYDDFTKGSLWVYGIMLSDVKPFDCPTSLLGIDKNPQWFRRVSTRLFEKQCDYKEPFTLLWR